MLYLYIDKNFDIYMYGVKYIYIYIRYIQNKDIEFLILYIENKQKIDSYILSYYKQIYKV